MRKTTILLILSLFLICCVSTDPYKYRGNTYKDIDIKKLALILNDSLRRPSLKNNEVGILTFVNLNRLEEAEPLGRYLQEKLSHALFDLGFRIIEIRLGKDIRFEPLTGELNLTRLKEKLKRTEFKEIGSLVMGTYIDAGDYVYVNSKFIELENSTIRASGEIKIRKGPYLSKLINLEEDTRFGSAKTEVYERFPIKPKKSN